MGNYVIFSKPGAGKDTLIKQLLHMGNFLSISTGEIYREQANLGTELGIRARNEYWSKGLICPDEMTNQIMKEALIDLSKKPRTLLINGYPRSIVQAEFLDSIIKIDALLHLNASDDAVASRLMKRGRTDDTTDVLKKRLEVYHIHANEIINYYKKFNRYIYLNAENRPEEVFHQAYAKIS